MMRDDRWIATTHYLHRRPFIAAAGRIWKLLLTLLTGVSIVILPASAAADPPVTAATFTSDGRGVIVGSQAGLRLYSWPVMIEQSRMETQLENIHHVAFAPNGERLLIAGGIPAELGEIEIYNWPDRSRQKTIQAHSDVVYEGVWSTDGTTVVTASADGYCKVIDADTGQVRSQFAGHSRAVVTVNFLDAEHCISGSVDQTIRIWKASDGSLLRTLNNHVDSINALSNPPNGAEQIEGIVSISEDRTVRLWQPRIGRLVKFARLTSPPRSVVWSGDGRSLYIATSNGMLQSVDLATMKSMAQVMTTVGRIHELLLDSSRLRLFVGGQNGFQAINVSDLSPVNTN